MAEADDTNTMEGGCHCGAVRFSVLADLTRVLACNCSMCSKKGFLHLIVEQDAFLLLSGQDDLSDYQFGTMTAHHLFCRRCGVAPFYRPRSHPDGISVNARCLDEIDLDRVQIEAFDGQNWEDSVARIR